MGPAWLGRTPRCVRRCAAKESRRSPLWQGYPERVGGHAQCVPLRLMTTVHAADQAVPGNNYSEGYSARGGQARSPYNLTVNPGGSSSGSATAVAANIVPIALGTETDGSGMSLSAYLIGSVMFECR